MNPKLEDEIIDAMLNETPDLSHMPVEGLVVMMLACAHTGEASDKAFSEACRREIARRKK